MKVKWLGHASFLIISDDGTRIITDPYNNEIGWTLPSLLADVLTISHDHYDHNNKAAVKAKNVITEPGEYNISHIHIAGWLASHGHYGERELGEEIIFKFVIKINVFHFIF